MSGCQQRLGLCTYISCTFVRKEDPHATFTKLPVGNRIAGFNGSARGHVGLCLGTSLEKLCAGSL